MEEITVSGEAGRPRAPEGYVARDAQSATKTSTPLVETPQAITVITDRQINDQRVQSLDEALNYSPGVRGQTFGIDGRFDWFLLRGFSAQETGYFLDGMQLFSFGYSSFQLEPWGLQSIDVVRGPNSSLYGGGNPGGVVNAVSKLPTFSRFGTAEVGINEFGNGFLALDAGDVAGANNEWSYRITALGRLGGTQVDHTDFNRGFVAPSISYRPNAATLFTLYGSYTRTDANAQNFIPYYGTVKRAPFGRIPNDLFTSDPNVDLFLRDQAMVGYKFEHEFDTGLKFRQHARYAYVDVNHRSLYGFGYAEPPTESQALLYRRNFLARDKAGIFNIDNQAEMQLQTGPLSHTVLFGLDYKRYHQKALDADWDAEPLDLLNPRYVTQPPVQNVYFNGTNSFDQLGVYAQDQIKIDRLSVLLGGRYDYLRTQQVNKAYDTYARAEETTGKFSGRAGLLYRLDSGFAPYVSYSTSFNPLIAVNPAGGLFRPETGEQWEVGVKYEAPGLPVTASIALFDLTRKNVPVTTAINQQVQTGEQNSRGIEAEVRAKLTEGLSLIASATAYQLEVTRDGDAAKIGKTPPGVPEHFASLWLDYTIPSGRWKGLGLGGGVRYVGRSFASFDNDVKVPASVVADLSLHYDQGPWRAAVNVSNLTDRKYVASCALVESCYYGERRRTTVSLAYRW